MIAPNIDMSQGSLRNAAAVAPNRYPFTETRPFNIKDVLAPFKEKNKYDEKFPNNFQEIIQK